ncbi:MAG: serpin family protein [Gemmatimonadaceae bacterium]|nr:serpin family protein [Gemmatimonadaceae bacterium]
MVWAAGAILVAACSGSTEPNPVPPLITTLPRALSGAEQVAATATTSFGLTLFRSVNAQTARDQNLVLSPVSASLALGMLLNGAEGETLAQVRSTLGFGSTGLGEVNAAYKALIPLLGTLDPSVTMTFANAAWFDRGSPPSTTFSQRVAETFGATVDTASLVDPATVTRINAWVSAATNARIRTIVDGFDRLDIAILVNATYFKGKWRAQFAPSATRSAPFATGIGASVPVQMMSAPAGLARATLLGDGTVVGELPYGGDAFVMTIVMPPLGRIEALVDTLTPAGWQATVAGLPAASTTMLVELPKFRLEVTRQLQRALSDIGMPRPFATADLNPMFRDPSTERFVSSVLQKVFVDVNEEGTEAAAVTAITIRTTSAGPIPALVIDRPFLFAIRDRLTGTVLFLGKVVKPVAA